MRCAVDAAIKLGDSTQLVAVHALNEFDPKWSGGWARGWGFGGYAVGLLWASLSAHDSSDQGAAPCRHCRPSCRLGALGGPAAAQLPVRPASDGSSRWRRAGVDWRQKLENQRGAVLATELKNNANKIAKWTAAALVG